MTRKRPGPQVFTDKIFQGAAGISKEKSRSGSSQKKVAWSAQMRNLGSAVTFRKNSIDMGYGGSAKTISGFFKRARSVRNGGIAPGMTFISAITPVLATRAQFFSIIRITCGACSKKYTVSAPRLAASSPIAPDPANRSAKTSPERSPRLSKKARLARTEVGRTSSCSPGEERTSPRAIPATISITEFSFKYISGRNINAPLYFFHHLQTKNRKKPETT